MNEKVNVAVIYYSARGNVYQLARAVGAGAEQGGGEVRLHKVRELAPPEPIKSNPQWALVAEQTRDTPEASLDLDDLDWAVWIADGRLSSKLQRFLVDLPRPLHHPLRRELPLHPLLRRVAQART